MRTLISLALSFVVVAAHAQSEDLEIAEYSPYFELYTTKPDVKIRSAPDGPVLRKIKKGQMVSIYGSQGNWYRISPASFEPEYVLADHLSPTKPERRKPVQIMSESDKLFYTKNCLQNSSYEMCSCSVEALETTLSEEALRELFDALLAEKSGDSMVLTELLIRWHKEHEEEFDDFTMGVMACKFRDE